MLQAHNLAIGYPHTPLAKDLSLSVSRGEVLCLLGPNGCGKTTLFKTLLGLLPPLGGQLELDGRPIAEFSRREFARRIAYVPQASTGYFPFSVLDVVLMGRAAHFGSFERPGKADHQAVSRALSSLNIEHLAKRPFTMLSGGERQMVLIARALAQAPELIVMDEPTASLDYGNEARLLGAISQLSASGLGIILSTHNPGHAFICADKVVLMHRGAIHSMGRPEDVVTPEALHQIYGVQVAVNWLEDAGRNVCAPILQT